MAGPSESQPVPGDNGPRTSELVRRAHDDEAGERFGDLYRHLAPAVYAWAALRLRPPRDPSLEPADLVQEVWCRALRRFDTFDPARSSFRAWVFRIANNVLLEGLRRSEQRASGAGRDAGGGGAAEPADIPDDATSVSRRLAHDEALGRLCGQLASLPEEEKKLLLYRGLEGAPHAVVAERLGLSEAATMQRWSRLRGRLAGLAWPMDLFES